MGHERQCGDSEETHVRNRAIESFVGGVIETRSGQLWAGQVRDEGLLGTT